MKQIIVGLLAGACVATNVSAAPYAVMTSGKHMVAGLQLDTIRKTELGIRATYRAVSYPLQAPDLSSFSVMMEFDCQNERSRTLSTTAYDNQMEVVQIVSEPRDWVYASPGSAGEMLLKAACDPAYAAGLTQEFATPEDFINRYLEYLRARN